MTSRAQDYCVLGKCMGVNIEGVVGKVRGLWEAWVRKIVRGDM